jgi:hypothetical protein
MPDSAGKRQRREVKAKKQRARDERRTARNERREDRAARGADGPLDDWLSDEPVVRDIGDDGPGTVDDVKPRRHDDEPERAETT